MQYGKGKLTISKTIFLADDTLLSADSRGVFTLWAPVTNEEEGQLEFMQSVYRGHKVSFVFDCILNGSKNLFY